MEEKLELLNKYIEEYVNQQGHDIYLENMDECIASSKKVASMKDYTYKSPDWSRYISINDSIEYVYQFLKSIDPSLAERYSNILFHEEKNGKPVVNLKSRRIYNNEDIYSNFVDQYGVVHIFYRETPSDMFDILHEMLHKLNIAPIILENGEETESLTREVYGETASILGEFLLGEWAVKQGIITQNDFDKIISKRVAITKDNARTVLVQTKLIKMIQENKEINLETLREEMENENDDLLREIYEEEASSFKNIFEIINNEGITFPSYQRYVTALYNVAEAMNKDNKIQLFTALQDELSNPESDLNKVTPVINQELHRR